MILSMTYIRRYEDIFISHLKKLIRHITNFYLYSSMHIGLCSIYLYLFTINRFQIKVDYAYLLFTFSSTVFIYSIHRLIGINKVKKFAHKGRFAIIEKFKNHILIYAMISFLGCCYFFLNFDFSRISLLLGAGIISILYTIPIFGKSMRLRDFSFIKIFLIAIVWSYVCGSIPLYENNISLNAILIYFLEIVLFFIAITIPFDIRDFHVDTANSVKTLPTHLGREKSILLSLIFIVLTLGLDFMIMHWFGNGYKGFLSMLFTCIITTRIIHFVKNKQSDYYFSGLLDTTIMMPYSIYVLLQIIAS